MLFNQNKLDSRATFPLIRRYWGAGFALFLAATLIIIPSAPAAAFLSEKSCLGVAQRGSETGKAFSVEVANVHDLALLRKALEDFLANDLIYFNDYSVYLQKGREDGHIDALQKRFLAAAERIDALLDEYFDAEGGQVKASQIARTSRVIFAKANNLPPYESLEAIRKIIYRLNERFLTHPELNYYLFVDADNIRNGRFVVFPCRIRARAAMEDDGTHVDVFFLELLRPTRTHGAKGIAKTVRNVLGNDTVNVYFSGLPFLGKYIPETKHMCINVEQIDENVGQRMEFFRLMNKEMQQRKKIKLKLGPNLFIVHDYKAILRDGTVTEKMLEQDARATLTLNAILFTLGKMKRAEMYGFRPRIEAQNQKSIAELATMPGVPTSLDTFMDRPASPERVKELVTKVNMVLDDITGFLTALAYGEKVWTSEIYRIYQWAQYPERNFRMAIAARYVLASIAQAVAADDQTGSIQKIMKRARKFPNATEMYMAVLYEYITGTQTSTETMKQIAHHLIERGIDLPRLYTTGIHGLGISSDVFYRITGTTPDEHSVPLKKSIEPLVEHIRKECWPYILDINIIPVPADISDISKSA